MLSYGQFVLSSSVFFFFFFMYCVYDSYNIINKQINILLDIHILKQWQWQTGATVINIIIVRQKCLPRITCSINISCGIHRLGIHCNIWTKTAQLSHSCNRNILGILIQKVSLPRPPLKPYVEWNCIYFKCVQKPIESRLSL